MGETATYPHHVLKYCPSCGAPGFNDSSRFAPGVDGTNRFVCKTCGFRFYINSSIGTAAVVVDPDGNLLMTRRMKNPQKGTLDLPGGFAAPGERAEDAVRREVFEEVNINLDTLIPWQRTYLNEYEYGGITYFTNDIIYHGQTDDWSTLKVGDPGEVEIVLVPLGEVDPAQVGLVSIRKVVEDLLEYGVNGPGI